MIFVDVSPENDSMAHAFGGGCECDPLVYDEDGRRLCIHHSYDRREIAERQGCDDPAKPWIVDALEIPLRPGE